MINCLGDFFSTIKMFYLTIEQKSSLTCFQRLKELLYKELNKMLIIRRNLNCLYIVVHINYFFY